MSAPDHPALTEEEREDFLATPRVAVIATTNPDGSPHLAPLWFSWDGDQFVIATPPGSHKGQNIKRLPRFTLCVDKKTWPYRSLMADCAVSHISTQMGYPTDLAERYLEGHRLDDFIARYRDLEWAVIEGEPNRWYGHVNRE